MIIAKIVEIRRATKGSPRKLKIGLIDSVENRSDRFGRRKYTEYRFHDDQYKRDQDDPNDCAKLGKLGLIKLFLIHYVIRNGDKILLAAGDQERG